jgi:hypothetical protein
VRAVRRLPRILAPAEVDALMAALTVQPPPSNITCPKGRKLGLASASYTGVTLTDTTNGITVSLGDFATGCLLPKVRGAC